MNKIKPKKCKVCKGEFVPSNTLQKVCSPTCALQHVRKEQHKVQKKKAIQQRKELKKRKEALKTKSDWTKEAQKEFNGFIKERDKDYHCISCDREPDGKKLLKRGAYDAGHYLSIGARSHLRFHEDNCHKQCVYCNRELSGNAVEYRIRLIIRIGLERVEALENNYTIKRFTIDELKEIKIGYKERRREINKDIT